MFNRRLSGSSGLRPVPPSSFERASLTLDYRWKPARCRTLIASVDVAASSRNSPRHSDASASYVRRRSGGSTRRIGGDYQAMSEMNFPYLSFFPSLPLSNNLNLGEWSIGRPDKDIPWKSQRFRDLASAHLESFAQRGFRDGALMWHSERGFDGSKPDEEIWSAIHAAVSFAALDTNDIVRATGRGACDLLTSENGELFTQPIDEGNGYISIQKGGFLRAGLVVGTRIGEVVWLPESVIAPLKPVLLSQHLLTSIYTAMLDSKNKDSLRIRTTVAWHRKALVNAPAVKESERLIFLKTGFESLTGQSKTHHCARAIRQLFETAAEPNTQWLPWEGILWSPGERQLMREWDGQRVLRSELEDWFQVFGSARNSIIHKGTLAKNSYYLAERPHSRYVGSLFWTAERLLREALKAKLGGDLLLCGLRKEIPKWSSLMETVPNGVATADDAEMGKVSQVDVASELPLPADPQAINIDEERLHPQPRASPRDLISLLAALECDAANKVLLKKVVGHSAPTLEGARDNAYEAIGKWEASFEANEIIIDASERKTLEDAGAEWEPTGWWTQCD